jgi:hypothetical protein
MLLQWVVGKFETAIYITVTLRWASLASPYIWPVSMKDRDDGPATMK